MPKSWTQALLAPVTAAFHATVTAAAAGGLALIVVAASQTVAATPANAATATRNSGIHLRCSARTLPGRPLHFSPAVSGQVRNVNAQGSVALERCSSPDGTQRGIKTGHLTFNGSATATCTRARGVRGRATITWYDGAGHTAGASQLSPRPQGGATTSALLSGRVTSGRMSGGQAHGNLVPVGDVLRCGTAGLSAVNVRGTISFS